MGNTVGFNRERRIQAQPIIIYGASVYGELAYAALKQMGWLPDYYCDRSEERTEYMGVRVIHPRALKGFQEANIIIASADFFREIKKTLEEAGCRNLFDMTDMLAMELPSEELSGRALEMYYNRQHYFDIVANQPEEKLVFNRIQYVVTERCSLKCKDCSHLIQYYRQPQDVDLYLYKPAFEFLLEHVDYIAELRILGGEPFMNRNMGKLIDWYHDCEKIERFSIYTNGTIIPNDGLLEALRKDKVKIHISNYKVNEDRIGKLVEVFEKYQITYFVREYDAWQDAGGVACRNYTQEQKEKIFSSCFERNGYTFLKGKLYRCPRSAHAMNLRAMPDVREEYVNLQNREVTAEVLRGELKNLQERCWLEACNYCSGPNNHTQSIPAAIQISEPVAYEVND